LRSATARRSRPKSRLIWRHRGDPRLAELRREILGLLGLNTDW
jgi:hypothetical protein